MIKTWNFTFDIKATNTLPKITMTQGDTNSYNFVYNLMNGDVPVNLTNETVRLVLVKSDKKVVWKDFEIIDPINGVISILLDAQSVACLGKVDAQIKIYGLNEEVLTTTNFSFNIVGDLLNEYDVLSSPEWSSLTKILGDINQAIIDVNLIAPIHVEIQADITTGNALHTTLISDIATGNTTDTNIKASTVIGNATDIALKADIISAGQNSFATEVTNGRGTFANLKARGDNVDTQLADIVSPSTPNGADQTTELNTYFDTLASKGIKYANLNEAGKYLSSGDLSSAYKVLLRGNAKIDKSNPDNWFINVSSALGSFNEKINSSGVQSMVGSVDQGIFNQFKTALSQNRAIKVAIIGDSISATDQNTMTYSTRIISANANQDEPNLTNGIVADHSYTYALMDMLKDSFPGTTFSMNDYAVGGTQITTWDSTVTYWGTTQKWIDFCKLATPDVLVVAFGMNHANFDNSKTFANDLKSLIDYTKANFSPIPDIVVITAPRSAYVVGDVNYGNLENQGGRFMAANVARAIGKEYGAYVCDVGRLSDIKRVGLDYTRPIMKRLALTDFAITLSNCTDNHDGTYTFDPTLTGRLYLQNNYQKDFTLKVKLNFTTPVASDANMFGINFNKTRTGNFYDNRLNIYPKKTNNLAMLMTALRSSDYLAWGNSGTTGNYIDTVPYDSGADVTLTISKRADKIEIRKLNTTTGYEYICIQDYVDCWDVHGYFEFLCQPVGAGNLCTIKSIEVDGAEYPQYLPTLTENEMFGGWVNGDVSTKLPYGGSGANHPSSIGLIECYVPPLKEMVDDIVNVVRMDNRNVDYGIFPVTTTIASNTLNASLSYLTVSTKILSARLVSSGGTVYTLNKNITGWAGYVVGGTLGTNEFGMYMTDATHAQLLINAPVASGWVVTTYQ